MTKIKKLLCLALVVTLLSSLICVSASAEAIEVAKVTFADGAYDSTASTGNADPAFLGGVYGKAEEDYSAAFKNAEGDKFFSVGTGAEGLTVETGGKLKISYDIASNDFHTASSEGGTRATHGRYVGMKVNDVNTYPVILGPNGYTLDDGTTNQRATYSKLNDYAWNNVTAIFEFNQDNTAADYKLYINGAQVHHNAAYAVRLPKKVNGFRVGANLITTDEVYYDNFIVEAYKATDAAPTASFETEAAAIEGNEALIDAENKIINLEEITMTVADFNTKTTGFVVLDKDGNLAAEDAYVATSSIYAVYTAVDGINTYYDKYEISVEPPVITSEVKEYQEIIDNDTFEIRLVDKPELTAKEFVENTIGATVTFNGEAYSDDTLLSDCEVKAVVPELPSFKQDYTLVHTRSYKLPEETFENGTFTTRVDAGNKQVYSNGDVKVYGNSNGNTGVTFEGKGGVGGKEADDNSIVMTLANTDIADKNAVPFIYVSNPYMKSKTEIGTTHTIEADLHVEGMSENFGSLDMFVNNRKVVSFLNDGVIKAIDGTQDITSKVGTWSEDNWIPVVITHHKATNELDIYVNGHYIDFHWPASPAANDIRFYASNASGTEDASVTFALDNIQIYSDSFERYSYTVEDSTITLNAAERFNCVPIIAVYEESGKLFDVKMGISSKEISYTFAEGQTVKIMLWEKASKIAPLTNANTVVDRGTPVNARTATLSKAFTDNMVLQSDMPVTVWGTSADANGATLSVALGNEAKMAYVNDGKWEATFSAREASSEGETLTVTTAIGVTEVSNIAFGDVYFIGGQSNAYLPMNTVDTYQADKASFTENDDIRIFHQVGNYAATAQAAPVSGSKWEYATESTIGKMSAIGMYFAKTLKENGVDKPIGLISVARSGSSLHWNLPKSITDKYQINYMTDKTNQAYNALLAPVEKFSAKGMLWYQGENDSIKGSTDIISQSTQIYDDMFADFHAYLKETTKNNDFKIFSVQLSSHPSEEMLAGNATTGWQLPYFRSYQYDMVKNMDGVYLIPSQDCGYKAGDDDAAHPDYKKPIGERLAKAALYAIYGTETENNALSPMPDSISYEGSTVTIKFKNVAAGLALMTGDELKGFELIDENGNAVEATATISGTDRVIITNSAVSEAKGVRYAFYRSAPNTIANLADSNGLPCPTFTHDKGSDNGSVAQKIAALSEGAILD